MVVRNVVLRSRLIHLQTRFDEEPTTAADAIIRAASHLFVANGYDGTSTDAIATRAGVKPSALYRLFDSKDAIRVAALEFIFESFLADMQAAVAGVEDPAQRLVRLSWAHTWIQLTSDVFAREGFGMLFSTGQLMSPVAVEHGKRLRSLARAHVDNLRAAVDDGLRVGRFDVPDPRSAAQAILTIAEYAPLWFRRGGALSPEEVADHNALYALRTVAAEGADLALVRRFVADPVELEA
jgi:AcrR family transcriptional regulator